MQKGADIRPNHRKGKLHKLRLEKLVGLFGRHIEAFAEEAGQDVPDKTETPQFPEADIGVAFAAVKNVIFDLGAGEEFLLEKETEEAKVPRLKINPGPATGKFISQIPFVRVRLY